MKRTNFVLFIFSIALILRLILIFPQYSGDVKNHLAWSNGFLTNSLGFYNRHFPGFNDPNYPPITIFLFAIFNLLLKGINQLFNFSNNHLAVFPSSLVPLFSSENMQMGFLKLPAVFSDIGIGILLFKVFQKRQEKYALFLTSLYLFNPAALYVSSVWGQIESIPIFLLLLSLYKTLYGQNKRKFLAIPLFVLAALTKQTALWFLPLYLFLWFREINFNEWIKGILSGLAIFITSYLPFGLDPLSAFRNYLSTLSGSSNVVADAAWNLWFFLFRYPATPDSVSLGVISVRQASILLLTTILFLLFVYLSAKYSRIRFFNALFIWSLAVFFLQTRVHERHLAPAIVFLLLTPGLSTRFFIDYFLLSVYHMSNLYSSLRLPFI